MSADGCQLPTVGAADHIHSQMWMHICTSNSSSPCLTRVLPQKAAALHVQSRHHAAPSWGPDSCSCPSCQPLPIPEALRATASLDRPCRHTPAAWRAPHLHTAAVVLCLRETQALTCTQSMTDTAHSRQKQSLLQHCITEL